MFPVLSEKKASASLHYLLHKKYVEVRHQSVLPWYHVRARLMICLAIASPSLSFHLFFLSQGSITDGNTDELIEVQLTVMMSL